MQNRSLISNHNVLLVGFMGSGKTSVSKKLARSLNAKLVDIDDLVLKTSGVVSINKIFEDHGDQKFRELEKKALASTLEKSNQIIATGGGTLIYNSPESLRANNVLKKNDIIVYLEASFEICKQRCLYSMKRPLFKDLEKAKILYDSRLETYRTMADFKVAIDELSADEISLLIIDFLNQTIT